MDGSQRQEDEHYSITRGEATVFRGHANAVGQVLRIALLTLVAMVRLMAIGGIALATGLEGERYAVEWLRGTPFKSYVIPGFILAVVAGGSAVVAAVAMLMRPQIGRRLRWRRA